MQALSILILASRTKQNTPTKMHTCEERDTLRARNSVNAVKRLTTGRQCYILMHHESQVLLRMGNIAVDEAREELFY